MTHKELAAKIEGLPAVVRGVLHPAVVTAVEEAVATELLPLVTRLREKAKGKGDEDLAALLKFAETAPDTIADAVCPAVTEAVSASLTT